MKSAGSGKVGASHDGPKYKVEERQHHCPSILLPWSVINQVDDIVGLDLHGVFVAVNDERIDFCQEVCRAHGESTCRNQSEWKSDDTLPAT